MCRTVHPIKYSHSPRFVVFCCGLQGMIYPFFQGYLTDTETFLWLPWCRWSNPGQYGCKVFENPITAGQYNGVIMSVMAFQINSVSTVCSTVGTGPDQRKLQSFASLAFVRGIHRWPVNSPYERPVKRKMFPFDDVIMNITKQSTWK